MKNVLLLGDSIRQNYQEYVKQQLISKANVYYTNDNGQFCAYTLRYLHEWVGAFAKVGVREFDIVHFNCGLWDVLRLSNEKEPFTSREQYRIMLGRIVERIRFFYPNAQLIFALTTQVIEPGFEPGIQIGQRKNSDIIEYNKIAVEVMNEKKVPINDLWAASEKLYKEGHSESVHFNTEIGIEMLGNQVVNMILNYC